MTPGTERPLLGAARPRDLLLEQHREGSPEQEVLRHRVRAGGFAEGSPASLGRSSDHSPPLRAGGTRLI